ncbi:hypothetical protein GQ651_13235 [Alphaproteobacteria bacterium GH1-50]|uniref:Osmotically inducible lipoprotein OsmB n=1 Tax=Kangsaoukella pontilimi TaxID=2691042 RepID=A0A7C9MKY2_9RHOB|nr:hypothetical protein [Kangsaoukella pontilimi]MXQ08815.1 hypothetical protein [Kangsaoukella pontilimi]
MGKPLTLLAIVATLGLAACGDNDLERGVSGAAIGAVGAELTGGNAVTGAAVGGAAGVFCDDLTPQLCR